MLSDIDNTIAQQFGNLSKIRDNLVNTGDTQKAEYYNIILNSSDIFKNMVKTQLVAGNTSFESIYKDLTKE